MAQQIIQKVGEIVVGMYRQSRTSSDANPTNEASGNILTFAKPWWWTGEAAKDFELIKEKDPEFFAGEIERLKTRMGAGPSRLSGEGFDDTVEWTSVA